MEAMVEFIKSPWPWYVVGPIMGLTVPLLLLIGNKHFGISSSLRHVCAIVLPANLKFFNYNWRREVWNLIFVLGVILGAVIATQFMNNGQPVAVGATTHAQLAGYGITDNEYAQLLPASIFGISQIFTWKGVFFLMIGGFMVGFGTRYAGGCTTGHSITGMANLQLPSFIATLCFMAGGFITTVVVIPYLFEWFGK
ncbi:MAG: YeeE/YedE family protein [Bacteroidia bacterium]|nr:YeeE/YedE family protein [Bacteroidia bacterium]